jgi:hypothetical protein
MKSYLNLSDEEVWDAAFYVMTLRYDQPKADKDAVERVIKDKFRSIELSKVATLSDNEIAEAYKADESDMAILRYHQSQDSKGQFIDAALKYIDESMLASRDGKYEEAEKLSSMAYLEGIEPIEKQLRSTDPALMERIEEQMANTRRIINEHRGILRINDCTQDISVS